MFIEENTLNDLRDFILRQRNIVKRYENDIEKYGYVRIERHFNFFKHKKTKEEILKEDLRFL